MKKTFVKLSIGGIPVKLTNSAGYDEAINELYVCKKIARGKKAANEGQVVSHETVKREFRQA